MRGAHHCSGPPSPKWPILCRVGLYNTIPYPLFGMVTDMVERRVISGPLITRLSTISVTMPNFRRSGVTLSRCGENSIASRGKCKMYTSVFCTWYTLRVKYFCILYLNYFYTKHLIFLLKYFWKHCTQHCYCYLLIVCVLLSTDQSRLRPAPWRSPYEKPLEIVGTRYFYRLSRHRTNSF